MKEQIEQRRTYPIAHAIENAIYRLRELSADLDAIPSAPPCFVCGEATRKTIIGYEFDRDLGDDVSITIRKSLPGHTCNQCGASYRDPELSNHFLSIIAESLSASGQPSLEEVLRPPFSRTIGTSPLTDDALSEIQDIEKQLTASGR